MENKQANKNTIYYLTVLVGNALDHYDTYIYVLLVPYIAGLFFNVGYELGNQAVAYGIAAIGILTRPLGAIVFSRIAAAQGPVRSLQYSLTGVAISTCSIAIIPTKEYIGIWAAVLMSVVRALQSFFSAGEGAVAGLYIVSSKSFGRNVSSSLYSISTIAGMLLATWVATFVANSSDPLVYWRLAFALGFLTTLVSVFMRFKLYRSATWFSVAEDRVEILPTLRKYKDIIYRIAIINGFSYITYPIAFTIMNSLVPIVRNVPQYYWLSFNFYLLVLDGMVIPVACYILYYVPLRKFMITCAACSLTSIVLLCASVTNSSLEYVIAYRVLLIIVGVSFSIATKVWIANITDSINREKYLVSAVGGIIGIEILGRTIIPLALCSFARLQSLICVPIYAFVLGLLAIRIILKGKERRALD